METGKEKGKTLKKKKKEMRKSAKNRSLAGPFQPFYSPPPPVPWRFFTWLLVKE
jgi:hypothetical protein